MTSIGKLTYFSVMAKGLPLTMVLEAGGANYEGAICGDWPTLKATGIAPFGQLPLFESNGLVVGQCIAIVNHIARKTGQNQREGLTAEEQEKDQIRSDMLLAEAEDLYGLLQKNVDTAFVKGKLPKEEGMVFWTGDGRGTLNDHFANLEKFEFSGPPSILAGEAYLLGMMFQMSLCKADFLDAAKFPKLSAWYTSALATAPMQKAINGDTPMGKFSQYFQM